MPVINAKMKCMMRILMVITIVMSLTGSLLAQTCITQSGNDGTWQSSSTWDVFPTQSILNSGTVYILHSITKNSPLKFMQGNGNMVLNGGSLTIGSSNNPKNLRFFQNTNCSIQIGSGDTLIVTNHVLMDANAWNNSITIDNGGVMIIWGNLNEVNYNNLVVNGVLVVCGNLTISNLNFGNGDIYVAGTAIGNYVGPTLHSNFDDLVIDYPLINTSIPCAVVLPVELISFNARIINQTVELSWLTESELNNDYFRLERSKDAVVWQKIVDVNGAGNSQQTLEYMVIDENPYSVISYYRLIQFDFDGMFEFSNIISVSLNNTEQLSLYPNPSSKIISVVGCSSELEGLAVYTLLGKNMTSEVNVYIENDGLLQLDLNKLKSGVYIIKTKMSTRKIVKL